MRILNRTLGRLKYGRAIVVVSGLPRSGTSMLMNMLHAGGMEIYVDGQRDADIDNPRGYFEHDRVKGLESDPDKRWLRGARGKAIKIISHLLHALPADNRYKIILATRDLREVIASQNKMLDRLGQENPVHDEKALRSYEKHLRGIRSLASVRSNFEMMEVAYADVVASPQEWAGRIAAFTDQALDCAEMSRVVEAALYRNRADRVRLSESPEEVRSE